MTVCSSLFVSSSATNETYLLTYEAFENVKVGVLGYWAFYFLAGVAFGGSWSASFPDLSALLATVLSFVLSFISVGLGILFSGFAAIAVANYRTKKQLVPNE